MFSIIMFNKKQYKIQNEMEITQNINYLSKNIKFSVQCSITLTKLTYAKVSICNHKVSVA